MLPNLQFYHQIYRLRYVMLQKSYQTKLKYRSYSLTIFCSFDNPLGESMNEFTELFPNYDINIFV